jgi:hypothetical protein
MLPVAVVRAQEPVPNPDDDVRILTQAVFRHVFEENDVLVIISQEIPYEDIPALAPNEAYTFLLNNGLLQATLNPDADPETTTVDGVTSRSAGSESWSALRNGAGDGSSDNGVTMRAGWQADSTLNQWNVQHRDILLFDTSFIPDTWTVTSATLNLYATLLELDGSNDGALLHVVTSAPASNTALVNADYGAFGDIKLDDGLAMSSVTTAYNTFTLNATGVAAISLDGITKLGVRTENDIDNSAPVWVSGAANRITFSTADETGTSQDPQLVVTYGSTVQQSFEIRQYNLGISTLYRSASGEPCCGDGFGWEEPHVLSVQEQPGVVTTTPNSTADAIALAPADYASTDTVAETATALRAYLFNRMVAVEGYYGVDIVNGSEDEYVLTAPGAAFLEASFPGVRDLFPEIFSATLFPVGGVTPTPSSSTYIQDTATQLDNASFLSTIDTPAGLTLTQVKGIAAGVAFFSIFLIIIAKTSNVPLAFMVSMVFAVGGGAAVGFVPLEVLFAIFALLVLGAVGSIALKRA